MNGLVDEFGRSLSKGPAVKAQLDKRLTVADNQFEGVVRVNIYMDAIEGSGTCAHCAGPIEGVLRFPRGYRLSGVPDAAERQADAKRQLYEKLKREHFCIARVDGPKLPVKDFLKRFE